MASARGKWIEEQEVSRSRKAAAADKSRRREGDPANPFVMPTLQTPASLQGLQRLIGNHAVVDMIANGQAELSPGLSVQREGEPAPTRGGGNRLYVGNLSLNTSRESIESYSQALVRFVRCPCPPTAKPANPGASPSSPWAPVRKQTRRSHN